MLDEPEINAPLIRNFELTLEKYRIKVVEFFKYICAEIKHN
jgi:hypothetical protein